MRRNSSFSKKRYLMVGLFILVIAGISIGYAALQTTLTINGTTKIKKTTFQVCFENARQLNTEDEHSIDPTATQGDSGIAINANDCTKASWSVTLNQPGDFYEFSIDVHNTGTLNAKLGNVAATQVTDFAAPSEGEPKPSDYIGYSITPVAPQTSLPAVNDLLNAGNKYTLKFKVWFKTDIDPEDLPRNPQTLNFDYALTYNQV